MGKRTYRDYDYTITNQELITFLKEKYKLTEEDFPPNDRHPLTMKKYPKPMLVVDSRDSGLSKETEGVNFKWTLELKE